MHTQHSAGYGTHEYVFVVAGVKMAKPKYEDQTKPNSPPKILRRPGSSVDELSSRSQFFKLFQQSPIPNDEMLGMLGLFINRQVWSRYLYLDELYKQILPVHGVVMEFGVRWGQNLALFTNL